MMKNLFVFVALILLSAAASVEAFVLATHIVKHRIPTFLSSTTQDKDSSTPKTAKAPPATKLSVQKEHAAFKAWPEERIMATGDYAEQSWLEEHIGGPLYSAQQKLPSLPVPDLEDTVHKLLSSGMPIAENKREKQYFGAACHYFADQAAVLQERLVKHAQDCNAKGESWLQKFWQTNGYLQERDPLSPCVSYFLFVPDDNDLQGSPKAQIQRASAILYSMAEARQQICSGQMAHEFIGSAEENPLCSTGFKYLFHATRIPQRQQDCYHLYDPSKYSHVIVASKGQFYTMEFCDPITADPLPLAVLEARLQHIQDHSSNSRVEMGWLTSCNRDVWADARQELLTKGGDKMQQALQVLESGAFVLNLDDDEPQTTTEAALEFWHGGKTSGGNRWFDKALQIVVSKNAKVGYVGEHSMLDAAPVIPLLRRILKTSYKRLSKKQSADDGATATTTTINSEEEVTNIFGDVFQADPDLAVTATKLTAMANEHHNDIIQDYELHGMVYSKYGKKYFKNHGLNCNDVVQMAMQLASYRLFGNKQVGTYEAALTRTFLHGRTENARPVSFESKAFLESMENDDCVREEKIAALRRAANAHAEYVSDASRGMGVDRHLFGLANMIQKGDKHQPVLFSDPVFQHSKNWRLSTSAVIFCPGFGPSAEDGIGVGYMIGSDSCQFTLTAKAQNNHVEKFGELLDEALTEIGDLFDNEDRELAC